MKIETKYDLLGEIVGRAERYIGVLQEHPSSSGAMLARVELPRLYWAMMMLDGVLREEAFMEYMLTPYGCALHTLCATIRSLADNEQIGGL